jgi:hypothetical protein
VIRIPQGARLDDPKALAEFGRRAAQVFVETDDLPPAEREAEARNSPTARTRNHRLTVHCA